jgi:hypothetical protein
MQVAPLIGPSILVQVAPPSRLRWTWKEVLTWAIATKTRFGSAGLTAMASTWSPPVGRTGVQVWPASVVL